MLETVNSGAVYPLVADALVWDMVYPLEPSVGNDLDALDRWHATGFNVVSLTIAGDDQNAGEAFRRVAAARNIVLARSDQFHLIYDIRDVGVAKDAGKLGISFHFEGTRCFERDLNVIEAFVRLGVRHTLLAFNSANCAGSGCAEKTDGGLTAFGTRLVCEMQRVGMLVDLSHVGFKTSMDTIEASTRPVIFSHSNVDAVAQSFRNLRDEQIRGCAATGGVVGLSASSEYLGDWNVRPETFFRHLDYIVQMVGPRHVGLGLDVVIDAEAVTSVARSRPDQWPMALDASWRGFRYLQPEALPELVDLMLSHGYGEDAVRSILGKNFERVCLEAWKN